MDEYEVLRKQIFPQQDKKKRDSRATALSRSLVSSSSKPKFNTTSGIPQPSTCIETKPATFLPTESVRTEIFDIDLNGDLPLPFHLRSLLIDLSTWRSGLMWKGETVFFLLYVLSHVREGIHKESFCLWEEPQSGKSMHSVVVLCDRTPTDCHQSIQGGP